jgi:Flp pilus assembly protein TadD
MSKPRLETLKELLAQNPDDSFIRYGVAMEHLREGDYAPAVEEFRELLKRNPEYVAAYYHCGQALEKLGDLEGARSVYESGIALCTRTGDLHTRSELQTALDLLG